MGHYCLPTGKHVYCDKSLDSPHYLPVVYHSFPTVRCVILVRHVMDTIASGLEASPWGFSAFGYTPYVQSSPDNLVAALARYWESHVSATLEWHTAHPDHCYRLRYEDLVENPVATLTGLFRFLGVEIDMSVIDRAFATHQTASGPGDYKLAYTTGMSAASVGRGKTVPVGMLPGILLARLNGLLDQCGYAPLDHAWNAAPRATPATPSEPVARQLAVALGAPRRIAWPFPAKRFGIVADDQPDLSWIVDPCAGAVTDGDGDVDFVLTGAADDLIVMLRAEVDLGVLLRSGRVRYVPAEWLADIRLDVPRLLRTVVALFASEPRGGGASYGVTPGQQATRCRSAAVGA